jgi:uncharacterized protein YjbI with pentapeptide repeats
MMLSMGSTLSPYVILSEVHAPEGSVNVAKNLFVGATDSSLRNASQRFATLRNASQRFATLRNASQRFATLRNASQREALLRSE